MISDRSEYDIAVLITCFNRRETTLRCLRALYEQQLPAGVSLRVLLTDDGSSDGTGDAVRMEFPQVTLLQGDGNLYWVGGTMMAWEAARPACFYLWLNDDVVLRPGAIGLLLDVHFDSGDPATIAVGATCDPDSGATSTGGMQRRGWYDVRVMDPADQPQMCDSINGNIVLVPRAAEERIGALDPAYTHFFADGDYGIRARAAGIPVLLAPGRLGECRLNPIANSSFDPGLPLRQRWQRMLGPKGYRPPRQWWAFVRAHAPRPKLAYWIAPYALFGLESLAGGRIRLRRNVRRPSVAPSLTVHSDAAHP
jgi:glycosyltransferase involved in cell wall biosynthesis